MLPEDRSDAFSMTASDAFSIASTPRGHSPSTSRATSRAGTPPMTPRSGSSIERGPGSTSSGPSGVVIGGAGGPEVFRFRIPENCHPGPEVAFDLAPEQTPPRLPRKLVRTMTRSISLVLETMPTSSSWTKIFLAERLSLFVRVLALPCRVVFHHFSPLLHASRPSLLHAFLVVIMLFSKEIREKVHQQLLTPIDSY